MKTIECPECDGEVGIEQGIGPVCQECGYILESGEIAEYEAYIEEDGVIEEL